MCNHVTTAHPMSSDYSTSAYVRGSYYTSACEVWRVRVEFQVFRNKFHTHVHKLSQKMILSYINE